VARYCPPLLAGLFIKIALRLLLSKIFEMPKTNNKSDVNLSLKEGSISSLELVSKLFFVFESLSIALRVA